MMHGRIRRSLDVLFLAVLLACGSASSPAHADRATGQAQAAPDRVNIAHRGASAYAPEHTLAAYRLAIEMEADYVEQDLQLTQDGVLVCLHDTTLNRTTNVEEMFPDRYVEVELRGETRKMWRVSDFTLAEIKRLDAGSWFGPEFTGARVPTFQEAIDLVAGGAGLYPETKEPASYDALGFNMEAEVARVLAANGLDTPKGQAATPIFVQSFSPDSLKRFHELVGSTYPLIQLVGGAQAETVMSDEGLVEVAKYAVGVGPSLSILLTDPSRAAAARALGLEIHPYTVSADDVPDSYPDAAAYMEFLLDEIGVTGIFTDNPDLFPEP